MKLSTILALTAGLGVAAAMPTDNFDMYAESLTSNVENIDADSIDMHGLESADYFYERKAELQSSASEDDTTLSTPNGNFGIDFSTYFSVATIQCLRGRGYSFSIPRGYLSIGRVDPNFVANVANSRAGGMKYVDAYFFPCPTCGASPQAQFNQFVQACVNNRVNIGMVWLDIEGQQYWTGNAIRNRQWFENLLQGVVSSGFKAGIYSSKYMWEGIFGTGYTRGSNYPLWYAHYDNWASMADFVRFGGFSKPAIKQYAGDVVECGAGIDRNFY